jgi:hypothetical protein
MKFSYIHFNETWYANALTNRRRDCVDEVTLRVHTDDDEIIGEVQVRWYKIGKTLSPRLEVYDDEWAVLPCMSSTFKALATYTGMDLSPDHFIQVLRNLGYEDVTEKEPQTA